MIATHRLDGRARVRLLALVAVITAAVAAMGLQDRPARASLLLTVDTTSDAVDASPGDGVCATSAGQCALRAAVQEANASAGADAINVPAGTYILRLVGTNEDAGATGDLDITESIAIDGAGARNTFIQAQELGVFSLDDRLFDVRAGSASLRGLTVRYGRDPGTQFAPGEVYPGGGGIRTLGGTALSLDRVTVATNSAVGDNLFNNPGGRGGGILSFGTLTATRTTFHSNYAYDSGGALALLGPVDFDNVTISGNTAQFGGGGIIGFAKGTFDNVTITANSAGHGGAMRVQPPGYADTLTLRNTIVAGNTGTIGIAPNCYLPYGGVVSGGYSLGPAECGIGGATGDQVTTNPGVAARAYNGGETETHALNVGSAAINNGSPATPGTGGDSCVLLDQRGFARADRCDIGAFEGSGISPDEDADGVPDGDDNCPTFANADQTNADGDGQGDACDADDDNDGVADGDDPFPFDPEESADNDGDGTGDNADTDDDNDGQSDVDEVACGSDSSSSASTSADNDGDGSPDCVDGDDDNDGVGDGDDAFPFDADETADNDGDGTGDNADTDDDNDGQSDVDEVACGSDSSSSASTSADNDGDGSPDCVDGDDDNDGVGDGDDAFPFDADETADNDGDGTGDNADADDDNDGQSDVDELVCGSNPVNGSVVASDNDSDGSPDCVDGDDDNDGVGDGDDAFPTNPNETADNDGDGTGDNADTDDDNDGYTDTDETGAGSDPRDPDSTPEVCDGVDNDGDGGIDEGAVCDTDLDDDGIENDVDEQPTTVSTRFSDGVATAGAVISKPAGITFTIADNPNPALGIRLVVTGDPTKRLRVQVDGKPVVRYSPGTYDVTDPDEILDVATVIGGPAEIEIVLDGAAATVVVESGETARLTEFADGRIGVSSLGGTITVEATIDGAPVTVAVDGGEEAQFTDSGGTTQIQSTGGGPIEVNGASVPAGQSLTHGTLSQVTLAIKGTRMGKVISLATSTVDLAARLSLDSTSDGLDPGGESMTITVGTYRTAVPDGGFKRDSKGRWNWSGSVDGASLKVALTPVNASTWTISVSARGANLSGTTNLVPVAVAAGDDIAAAAVTAKFS